MLNPDTQALYFNRCYGEFSIESFYEFEAHLIRLREVHIEKKKTYEPIWMTVKLNECIMV